MRTWRPGPLDERGKSTAALGGEELNPQLQDQNLPCCRLHHPRMGVPAPSDERAIRPPQWRPHNSQTGHELLDLTVPVQAVVTEDPACRDPHGLGEEPPPFAGSLDRARARGRCRRLQPDIVREIFDARGMVRIGNEDHAFEVTLLQEA